MKGQKTTFFLLVTCLLIVIGTGRQPAHAQCVPTGPEGPFGTATCSDLIDNDCDGKKDAADFDCYNNVGDPAVDDDGDGKSENQGDCNDNDPAVFPGAPKLCDAKDNNCDGRLDFSTDIDGDGDGYAKCGDCNDNNPAVNPGALEGPLGDPSCGDGIDNDCDYIADTDPECSSPCFDSDGDGYGLNGDASCPNGTAVDCNDSNPNINPGASDNTCNNIDEDCSLLADDGYVPTSTNCGVGACLASGVLNCLAGGILDNTCQPGTPGIEGPQNDPTCTGGVDEDCDGLTDGADPNCSASCVDNDGDGYGLKEDGCPFQGIDCDDNDSSINPGASDNNCNTIDEDCSFVADDGYVADTSCGFGICQTGNTPSACVSGVETACQPGAPSIEGPQGSNSCIDSLDNDCDGLTDLNDSNCNETCVDNDNDGYGSPGDLTCPNGSQTDCDDTDANVYPGAPKICDGKDSNCDGRLDFSTDIDGDGDGYAKCDPGECNDNNPDVNAGAQEGPFEDPSCSDGIDNDCDFQVDTDAECADPCNDFDRDGYGANGDPRCPNGPQVDCNDNNPAINPGASDTNCNNIDEDCSLVADDGYVPTATTCGVGVCASAGLLNCLAGGILDDTCTPWTPAEVPEITCDDTQDNDCDGLTDSADTDCVPCSDNDFDGYGTVDNINCQFPGVDCNDSNPAVNPGASDANCNNVDENCTNGPDDGYFADASCGIGACFTNNTPSTCVNGVETACQPGTPGIEGPAGAPSCSGGIDEDCDGLTDSADPNCSFTCFDNDFDGYGNPGNPGCPGGAQTDCDDMDRTVYPGAPKLCDGKDNNCDARLDFAGDVDSDNDGFAVCGGDCNDSNPGIFPGAKEGPSGDPTCSDGIDNDCDNFADSADNSGIPSCVLPSCRIRIDAKNGPHLFDLLDPADDSTLKISCTWCHYDDSATIDERFKCERCHADPEWGGPDDGTLKQLYPLAPPYGFGTAANVRLHSSTVTSPRYGNWDMGCTTCHNPHLQEQDARYGTTYGKYIKEYICYDNQVTGSSFQELIEFTAPSGPGSYADGPPHNENVCEMCHTNTNHHRRTGDAPDDLDSLGNYVGHSDEQMCTECHVHSDGFMPAARPPHNTNFFNQNCQFCHVEIAGMIEFDVKIPDSNCKRCHGLRKTHTGDPARNKLASGNYSFDVMCVDCHEPMNAGGNNHMFIRPTIAMSVIPGSPITVLTKRGSGSLADGPPRNENVCETCHSLTSHNRGDGTGDGVHADGNNYDGTFCMLCHDHNKSFMAPGKACQEENDPGSTCSP